MSAGNGFLRLATPEGVPLDFEPATVAERIHAFLLDGLLIFLGLVLMFLILGVFAGTATLSILGVFFLRQGYFFFFEIAWNGSTPGKRSAGILVVSRDGGPLTGASLLARNLMRDLEVFLPLAALLAPAAEGGRPFWLLYPALAWLFVGAALPLLTKERLRMGDLLGGTVVVRLPREVLLEDPAARKGKEGILFSRAHLEIYGERELEVLAEILRSLRRRKRPRKELVLLAKTIARKVGYQGPEPQEEPLTFLEAFYASQRRHLEEKLLFGRRKISKEDGTSGGSGLPSRP